MTIPIRQQIDNAVSGTAAISLTLTSALVGDVVVILHADNFHTAAEMTTPTGTAVGGGWQLKHTLDGGLNDNHAKVWMGTVTTAGGTAVEGTANTDHERYLGAWVLPGTVLFDTAASTDSDATSVTHVAPTVTPTVGQLDDLLICLFGTQNVDVNYTMPGSMTAQTERDTGFATYRGADEHLTSDAATGTRTATASVTDTWFAVSVLVQSVIAGGAAPMARRGPSWQRRFRHPQILAAAPVVAAGPSGDGVVAQRSSIESIGIKGVSGASVAQQRIATTETGTKGATGAGQSVARATAASTGQKNATGAAPTVQRSSTATTVRKNGSGAGVVQQRNLTGSTATKAATGAGIVQQRGIVTSTGSSTPPVGGLVVQRVTTTSTGIKNVTGAGVTRCRTLTGSTGVHGGTGAGTAVSRTSTGSTGVHRGTGTGVAVARLSSASTGVHRGTAITAAATCRTSSQAIGIRSTSGAGRVQQRIIAIATGEQVAAFAPLLDPVGSARPNTAAARPRVNVGAATAGNTAATGQRPNPAAGTARPNEAEASP